MSNLLFDHTKKIMDTREDVSNFLFHLTKEPDAQMTLDKILCDGKLIAVNVVISVLQKLLSQCCLK